MFLQQEAMVAEPKEGGSLLGFAGSSNLALWVEVCVTVFVLSQSALVRYPFITANPPGGLLPLGPSRDFWGGREWWGGEEPLSA